MSLPQKIRDYCESFWDIPIQSVSIISGGDINEARLVTTKKGLYFLKFNQGANAFNLLESEVKGLAVLSTNGKVITPNIDFIDQVDGDAFLVMEYIQTGQKSIKFWQSFGESLANLHRQTNSSFGLNHANFIGSLPQSNTQYDDWIDFYIKERLQVQINLAQEKGLVDISIISNFEKLFSKLKDLLPDENPALIHGDLWSGNFLVNQNEEVVYIDPSVSYSNREMDIAMTLLFGGFDSHFYTSYQETYPLIKGFEERCKIYQLYYLMVHVNLFGKSYLRSVEKILQRFL